MDAFTRENVKKLSAYLNEPEWMLEFRLKGYAHYLKRPLPEWGADLHQIDFDDIYYYIKLTVIVTLKLLLYICQHNSFSFVTL